MALSCKEIGATGTAVLAGVSVGAFESIEDVISAIVKTRRVFTPNKENSDTYRQLYKKYANIYTAVKNL